MKIYTDGSCDHKGNGGWAFVVVRNENIIYWKNGRVSSTTNNRMELTAAIEALKHAAGKKVELVTDSKYVERGANYWAKIWKNNNWMGSSGPVKNNDLWRKLLNLMEKSGKVTVTWIKSRSGCPFNNYADFLSREK